MTTSKSEIKRLIAINRRLREALANLLDTIARTTVYNERCNQNGVQYGKTQLTQAFNEARKALEGE